MNVLLINGSPHAHGCTDAALQEIAKALNADGIETTIYHIGAVPVGGCVAAALRQSWTLRIRRASR